MTEKKLLPELAQHESDSGLWISSIFVNSKHTKLSSVGEIVSIAYSDTEAMNGFVKMLCRTFESGADLEASPRLTASNDLIGQVALIGFEVEASLYPNGKHIELSHIESLDLIHELGSKIKENGCRVAIIEDATPLCCNNPRMAMNLLSEIAARQQAIIFAFFKVSDGATALNEYLANHVCNLCQIGKDSLNNGLMDYCYFDYGNPRPERIVFDVNGGAIANCARLLRMERVVKTFARKWLSLAFFKQIAFGAMGGEYAKATIEKDVSVAADFGLIDVSGTGNRKKLCLASGTMKRNPNKKCVALTALGDPYRNPNHTKQRKPILRIGDFRLIAPENTYSYNVRSFAIGLMGAILRGQRWLDFEIKTSYRNVLSIIVGADSKGSEWIKKQVTPREAKHEALPLPHGTNDEAFLENLKAAVNDVKPDFVFIHCFDRIGSDLYTKPEFCKEIANYARSKGVTIIAVSDEPIDKDDYELSDEYWEIIELVEPFCRNKIEEMGIDLANIFRFYAQVGNFNFLCRYKQVLDGDKRILKSATATENLRCFLTATFYWCSNTPYSDIEIDCVGYPITENIIRKAKEDGIIKVDYTTPKKDLKKSRITFIGK